MDRPSIFSDNFEMMNGFFDDSFWGSRSGLRTMTTMATDIFETKDGYQIMKAEREVISRGNDIPVTIREAFMLVIKSVNRILKQDLQMAFFMSMYQNSTTSRK